MRLLAVGLLRSRNLLTRPPVLRVPNVNKHSEGFTKPFDNMPFSIPNRFVTTLFFAIVGGIGFWAPFIIVWYSMAKRTM